MKLTGCFEKIKYCLAGSSFCLPVRKKHIAVARKKERPNQIDNYENKQAGIQRNDNWFRQ